jgi:hypothetical protein
VGKLRVVVDISEKVKRKKNLVKVRERKDMLHVIDLDEVVEKREDMLERVLVQALQVEDLDLQVVRLQEVDHHQLNLETVNLEEILDLEGK